MNRYVHFKFAHVQKLECREWHERSLERRRLKLMHMWQLRTMTDKDRLFTDGTIKSRTVGEFVSGKGHCIMTLISARDSAHDFFVKACVAVVVPSLQKWLHEVFLTMLMEQQTVTNPAVIHGLCATTKH